MFWVRAGEIEVMFWAADASLGEFLRPEPGLREGDLFALVVRV